MQTPNHSTPVGGGEEDSEGAMQSAWQEFMLSGKRGAAASGKKKKKKGRNHSNSNTTTSPRSGSPVSGQPAGASPAAMQSSLELKNHQNSSQRSKIRKKYWQILNAFRKTLQEDWLDVDDHLGDVVNSIVDLRFRVHMSSKYLHEYNEHSPSTMSTVSKSLGCGYRNQSQDPDLVLGHLVKDDVELALSHGLMQHEKMLVGARRLISSLNQAEEALGRRLDELMAFHLDVKQLLQIMPDQDPVNVAEDQDLALFGARIVEWARRVYTELAEELYRKQGLVQTMLDSVNDDLLYHDGTIDDNESTPVKVAEKCQRQWPRGESEENRLRIASLLSSTPWEQDKPED